MSLLEFELIYPDDFLTATNFPNPQPTSKWFLKSFPVKHPKMALLFLKVGHNKQECGSSLVIVYTSLDCSSHELREHFLIGCLSFFSHKSSCYKEKLLRKFKYRITTEWAVKYISRGISKFQSFYQLDNFRSNNVEFIYWRF